MAGPSTHSRTKSRYIKKRTFNGNAFRSRRAYSFAEIAERLGTHIRTVQIWRSEGLPILDDNTKPFLVMGADIRAFLKARVAKRKKPLKLGEFFCTRCQEPRKSRTEYLRVEFTHRRLGPHHKQAIIRGLCEVCGLRLSRFSSERIVAEWREMGLVLSEQPPPLNGSETSSLNTDMVR